jgi:HSP20 family protein
MANRDLIPSRAFGLPVLARDPFLGFRREMDRLFDDFFAPAEARSFASPGPAQVALWPSLDVDETEQAYTVTAELPGIDMKDIELDLSDNALTLRGEKRTERHEEDGGRRYSERSYGRFERSIPFGAEVDADHVEASCENGVLKVVLPKNAQARDKTRRIEIRGASGGNGQTAGAGQTTGSSQTTGTSQKGGTAGAG